MASVLFGPSTPCGFLIVRKGYEYDVDNPVDELDLHTALIQTDWDWAGVASRMGWVPCKCGGTDGTVDCHWCQRYVGTMLSEAYDWIREREGEEFEGLDDYLPDYDGGVA